MMPHKMNYKKINKDFLKLITSTLNLIATPYRYESGIIYSLYSDRLHLIEIGFAESDMELEAKIFKNKLTLLDKKEGKKKELNLLINVLGELGFKNSENLNFKYSDNLMRHLLVLGWPVGQSLYKQRKIKKVFSCV